MLTVLRDAAYDRLQQLKRKLLGVGLKWYLSSVEDTTSWLVDEGMEPPWAADRGLIALTWHGRQFLGRVALRRHGRRSLLVAPHKDGQLIGDAASRAGFRIIIGSGAQFSTDSIRKRGAAAFRSIISSLEEQRAVLMTADVPKNARIAGAGAVKLAQLSGAPIHCFAAITTNRIELRNWDRTHLVLPFGRGAILWSRAINVPRNASPEQLESARAEVQTTLNALHNRAENLLSARYNCDHATK